MLEIKNLCANVDGRQVLSRLNLAVRPGEIHAIMGPNGSGKSTLSKVIAGHPDYEVTSGDVTFEINLRAKSILTMLPEERARNGIFLAYQYPVEIPGVTNAVFLRAAFNAICTSQGVAEMDPLEFDDLIKEKLRFVGMGDEFINRSVNVGFSGGEKKRNEILQMAVLAPRLAILDETDSGLDVDSLRIVAESLNRLKTPENAFVLITHYNRILNYVKPDWVHILHKGQIIKSGRSDLALEIEARGYDWIIHGSSAVSTSGPSTGAVSGAIN